MKIQSVLAVAVSVAAATFASLIFHAPEFS